MNIKVTAYTVTHLLNYTLYGLYYPTSTIAVTFSRNRTIADLSLTEVSTIDLCIHKICLYSDCGSIENPKNGTVSFHNDTKYQSTANFRCEEGYDLIGNSTTICSATGQWTERNQTCSIKGMYLIFCVIFLEDSKAVFLLMPFTNSEHGRILYWTKKKVNTYFFSEISKNILIQ